MKRLRFLAILLFCASVVSVCDAGNIIYVDASGPNDPGTGTFDDPFRRIQDGIDAAVDEDVITIRPGLYTGGGNYNLDPNGLGITICSIDPNDPKIVSNTIIDPNRAGRGFYIHSDEDANCVISGLTIRNGYTGGKGGGIYCYEASPTIKNCTISGNSSNTYGGGLYFQYSDSLITKCVISDNTAANDGGGIELSNSIVKITNCIFNSNQANSYGGGTDFFRCDAIIRNCTFVGNTANNGGGLYCWNSTESDITVSNCIFWENQATSNSQIGRTASGTVLVSYCDVQGTWPGTDNIDTDPCFASFNPNGDPNVWDFHLQSEYGRWDGGFYQIDFDKDGIVNLVDFAAFAGLWMEDGNNLAADLDRNGTVDWVDLQVFGEYFLTDGLGGQWVFDGLTSPCIDAADPGSDWGSEPWPNGKRINMGAYGGTRQASKNGNPADFDVSGRVDFLDFAELSDKWLAEEVCIVDLTNNGVVDSADLAIFAKNWLWQRE